MPPEPPGGSEAETGEPAGRGLTATGPRRSHWAPADGQKVRGYGRWPPVAATRA
jgi:hypothetical protein